MALPILPKATAVWLVENTALSFIQIAEFCGLHELEIQAIADGDVGMGMQGKDPIEHGQLTKDELERCQADTTARLVLAKSTNPLPKARGKGARYTPVSKRQDRPDGIAWLLKHHPELQDVHISKLLGTTKPTIKAIREKSHWNSTNITTRNPVTLGLCTEADLEKYVVIARGRAAKLAAKAAEAASPTPAPAKETASEE